jgi:hypothetical protein
VAHHTRGSGNAGLWLTRSAAFAGRLDCSWERAAKSRVAMLEGLPLLSANDEEALIATPVSLMLSYLRSFLIPRLGGYSRAYIVQQLLRERLGS